MNVSMKSIAEKLTEVSAARIYFHKKPDGDAIGASYALALGLEAIGIDCEILCTDPVPAIYQPMTNCVPTKKVPGSVAIAIDSSAPARLGRYSEEYIHFCVDHHENNSIEAEYKYVDASASSCAQIVYGILRDIGIQVTPQIADLLYTGLVTDTLSFRSWSTNADSLRAAYELAACGANVAAIARRFSLEKTRQRMEIEQVLGSSFHYGCSGHILGCYFSYADMVRIGTDDSELEGLNTVVEQVAGVDIGVVVREIKPEYCRVSVRTSERFRADRICAVFGGGGHANAAGCELDGRPEAVLAKVEKVCVEAYETSLE